MGPSARPPRSAHSLRLALEALEDRRILAAFSYDAPTKALAITLDADGEMRVTSSGTGNYEFSVVATDTFKGTEATGLSGNGTKTLTVTSALDLEQVKITNVVSNTSVNFGTSTGPYVGSFDVRLTRPAGEAVPLVKVSGATAFAAAATLNVEASKINVEGATLSSQTGTITLKADSGIQVPGEFTGLIVNAATISTAGGSIALSGRGGDKATSSQRGVALVNNTSVFAGDDGKTWGSVSITGIGGASTGASNQGISIDRGSSVGSSGGAVTLTGTGGGGSVSENGVLILGRVTTDNPDGNTNTGRITITGTGGVTTGPTPKDNTGVSLGSTAIVQSNEGPISITGRGGAGVVQTPPATTTTSPGISLTKATVTSSSAAIMFTADSFAFNLAGGAVATPYTVTVRNIDAGQVISLGSAVNTQLQKVAARTIVIGRADLLPVIQQEPGMNIYHGSANLEMIGSKILLQGQVFTGGTQTYSGPVVLGNGPDLWLNGSGINFRDTLDGAKNLRLGAGTGSIQFAKNVGGTTPLASLTVLTGNGVKAFAPLSIDGSATGARASGLVFSDGVNGIDMQIPGSKIVNTAGSGIVVRRTRDSLIAGFTLTKNAVAGIQASGAMSGTTITGNRIDGAGKGAFGAHLSSATGLSFGTSTSGNVISGTSTGIVATGNMTGTAVRSNTVNGNKGGISLVGARNLVVATNGIGTNTLYGLRADGDASGTVVTGNAITATPLGVSLERVRGLTLGAPGGDNTIAAGTDASGAYVPGPTSVGVAAVGDLTGTRILANSISDNTIGLKLTDASYLTVTGNMLFRNRFQGIVATGNSAATTIESNTIEGSLPGGGRAAWGLFVNSATGLLVGGDSPSQANGIHGTDSAIFLTGLLTGTAIKSTIIRNTFHAIQLQAARGVWVQSNDINGAEGRGLSAKGNCSGSTVLLNTIHSGQNGVILESTQGLAVKNNRIVSNRSFGLFASGASGETKVIDNIIENNGVNIATKSASGGSFQTK